MTLAISSSNNIGSDTEFDLRRRSCIMNNRGLEIDPGELHVSMYPSRRKNFELY